MENTLENKADFLKTISGIGVKMTCIAKSFQIPDRTLKCVLLNDKRENTLYLTDENGHSDFFAIEEWQANLTILTSITDEDATEVCNLLRPSTDFKKDIRVFAIHYSEWHILAHQLLRSKGYALPYIGLTVEKQIEYGWIKLK